MVGTEPYDLLGERSASAPEARRRVHHHPTDETRARVRQMVAEDRPTQEIADVFGMSPPTLRFHYGAELGRSRHVPTAEMRSRVASLVADGASIAQIVKVAGLSRDVLFRYYRPTIAPAMGRR